jgi:hypothetical protein
MTRFAFGCFRRGVAGGWLRRFQDAHSGSLDQYRNVRTPACISDGRVMSRPGS